MKTLSAKLSSHIIESKIQLEENPIVRASLCEQFDDLLEYYDNSIPQYIADKFYYPLSEIIQENLDSHNYQELENKLLSKFSNNINDFSTYTGKGDKKSFVLNVKDTSIVDDNEFNSLLDFYNYYVRKVNKRYSQIIIAPIFSTKVTDYVWDTAHGKGLFFLPKSDIDNVLKVGIRPKGVVSTGLPKRFFMYATSENINNIDKTVISTFVDKLSKYKMMSKSNIGCIHVDLNKFENGRSIVWYKDNLMTEEEAVFTEQPIPAEYLSKIDLPQSILEVKGEKIDDQWINDEKPVMTQDGRQAIIVKIDMKEVPNIIHGQVKMKNKLFDYEWDETGKCTKAVDQLGNPKRPDDADKLVKAQ